MVLLFSLRVSLAKPDNMLTKDIKYRYKLAIFYQSLLILIESSIMRRESFSREKGVDISMINLTNRDAVCLKIT